MIGSAMAGGVKGFTVLRMTLRLSYADVGISGRLAAWSWKIGCHTHRIVNAWLQICKRRQNGIVPRNVGMERCR